MTVTVDTQRFEYVGNITGPIWIEVAGRAFPYSKWNDFPVIILGWWLQELHRLLTGEVDRIECYFMDGPYHFEIVNSASLLTITCCRDDEISVLVETQMEKIQDFTRSLVKSAQAVLNLCRERGWLSSDIDQLRTVLLNFPPK